MSIILHDLAGSASDWLREEWYGEALAAPFAYRFFVEDGYLVFRASCECKPLIHPEGKEGCFQEELWRYDVAEFFIASENLERYLEFNVNPAGAWWSEVFTAPRVIWKEGYATPEAIVSAQLSDEAWQCEARLPLSYLEALGIELSTCKIAVCAILNSPEQLFVTTASDCSGEPDFHRPAAWCAFDKK